MYQKALSNTGLATIYIDGFAGSGEVPLSERQDGLFDEDVQLVIAGSAERAMSIVPPFARYVFIDRRKACIEKLQENFGDHVNAGRTEYIVGDANDAIRTFCQKEDWRSRRAVVLLDPFGGQVEWATIEAIAKTKAIDLWYLFPAGLCVFRQIGSDGSVHHTHEASITRIVGTEAWKSAFLTPSLQSDLFGDTGRQEKIVTPESAAAFMIERLQSVFRGGVLDVMIPLGRHAYASYYLLFAWANPSPNAAALARTLSKAAVKATDRKHGRLV